MLLPVARLTDPLLRKMETASSNATVGAAVRRTVVSDVPVLRGVSVSVDQLTAVTSARSQDQVELEFGPDI
jgi:hypothetical protein